MRQDLRKSRSLGWVELDHALDQVVGLLRQVFWEAELSFEYKLVELFEAGRLEGHRAAEHSKEQDSQTPDVHKEALVAFVDNDLRRKVGRRSTLLLDDLALLDDFRYPEIADLHSFLAVQEDIVQLDVPVDD